MYDNAFDRLFVNIYLIYYLSCIDTYLLDEYIDDLNEKIVEENKKAEIQRKLDLMQQIKNDNKEYLNGKKRKKKGKRK